MKGRYRRMISILLMVAVLIQPMPTHVFATTEGTTTVDLGAVNVTELAADRQQTLAEMLENATILFEEEELREQQVKHFKLNNGYYVAIQYDTAVHYMDDGQWVEYDNTLRTTETMSSGGIASAYVVDNGDSVRVFANNTSTDALVSVQTGEYGLSLNPVETLSMSPMEPISRFTSTPAIEATVLVTSGRSPEAENSNDLMSRLQPQTLYSALEYPNAINGADLVYENYGNTIKESIVIPSPKEEYVYTFKLETLGVTPILQESGSIIFTARDGETVYTIPAPYMMDQSGEVSSEAYYSLSSVGQNWMLTVTADADWINAPGRSFPVILDPTIEEKRDEDKISATFTRSGYPNSSDTTGTGLYVGYYGNENKFTRSYIHINSLPAIPHGCEIIGAGFGLYLSALLNTSSQSTLEIDLYGLDNANGLKGNNSATEWENWANNLTWNNATNGWAEPKTTMADRLKIFTSDVGKYVTWDITSLAFAWYNSDYYNQNEGFMLRAREESSATPRATFHNHRNALNRPMMTVLYKNTVGLEDYYSYQEFHVGRAGTAYISDHSLQSTVVVPLIQSDSAVMPFALNLVYNSAYGAKYFSDYVVSPSEESAKMIHTKDYSNMITGVGWKLSAQQSVVPAEIYGKNYLVYNDADGTEHYFYETTANTQDEDESASDKVYADEDGLNYRILVNGPDYTLKTGTGYQMYFRNGYLTWEKDIYDNCIEYHYDSDRNRLTHITRKNAGNTDADGETLVELTYADKEGHSTILSTVTDEKSRTTEFFYSIGSTGYALRRIIFPDQEFVDYTYVKNDETDSIYRLKHLYDGELEYGVEFSYSTNADVRNMYEYIKWDPIYGRKLHAYRRSPYQTVYRDYGDDNIADTEDDKLLFCLQDYYGRTVCTYATDSTETEVYGASSVTYRENSDTDLRNNRIEEALSAGRQGGNLLRNSGFEDGLEHWTSSACNVVTANHYYGAKSVSLTASSVLQQTVTLAADETYTLSGYVKPTTGGRVYLAVLGEGTDDMHSESVAYNASAINQGWTRLTLNFTPEDSGSYVVAVICENGSAYTDALQLEVGEGASSYNLVEDSDFNYTGELGLYMPTGWYRAGDSQIIQETDSEERYGLLTGDDGLQRLNQEIPLHLPLNTTFQLSAWTKGVAEPNSVTDKTADTDPYFGMIIRLHFSDGTSEVHYRSFSNNCPEWQYGQGSIVPKKENNATGSITITKAILVLAYDNNINSVMVDHVSLREAPAQKYTYDEKGNPITVTQSGAGQSKSVYDDVYLMSYTAANGNKVSYTRDSSKHHVTTASSGGLVQSYLYSNSGAVTTSKIQETGQNASALYLKGTNSYTADGNYVQSTESLNGSTSQFAYDSYTGLLLSEENAADVTTYYDYSDLNDRPYITYIPGQAAVTYSYDGAILSSITRKSIITNATAQEEERNSDQQPEREEVYQTYNLHTNDWGQQVEISVGDSTLASYQYDAINSVAEGGGKLLGMTYGNGDSVSYEYDSLDRRVKTTYNDSGNYITFSYDGNGRVYRSAYHNSNGQILRSYSFEYDSLGRLIRGTESDGNGTVIQQTEQLYDAFGRIGTQRTVLGNNSYSESYSYLDGENGTGKLNVVTVGTGDKLHFEYGDLQRLKYVRVKNAGGTELFYTAYAYLDIGNNRTSNRIGFHNVRKAGGALISGYKYSYDELGNITQIGQSEGNRYPLTSYTYDALNQLETETFYDGAGNGPEHETVKYTYNYDTAGNLRSVSTEDSLLKTFEYSDGDWKDLLVSVKDETTGTTHELVYDEIGNPLTYGNGQQLYTNLNWEHGRQLASLTTKGITYSYKYDADGIRTEKTGNYVTRRYVTQGGKIVREIVNSADWNWVLDFIYDNAGSPFALKHSINGGNDFTTYYYILNLQGDVVGLMDTNCNVVARYTYNAWGEILSVTTDNGDPITNMLNLAHINPLRYRGYYYDSETGFYYLQSRYYDPENCRFINADCYADTGSGFIGTNMFSYCLNNPVSLVDPVGTVPSCCVTVAAKDGGPAVIRYDYGNAISVAVGDSVIYIDAYMNFSGDMDAEFLIAGIEKYWEGQYEISGKTMTLYVNVVEGKSIYGHTITVDSIDGEGRPGTICDETTWQTTKSSSITMYSLYAGGGDNAAWGMAHEFGHSLGVKDYYTHWYNHEPGYNPEYYSIYNNIGCYATATDVWKVILAFSTNSHQDW